MRRSGDRLAAEMRIQGMSTTFPAALSAGVGPGHPGGIVPALALAVTGFCMVPIYSDTTTAEWADTLVRVVRLAAAGPLTEGE